MARHVERPYVFLGDIKAEYVSPNRLAQLFGVAAIPTDKKTAIDFKYSLQNHGRMPAVVYEVKHDLGHITYHRGENRGLDSMPPAKPIYNEQGKQIIIEVISGLGGKTKEYVWTYYPKERTGPFGHIPVIYGWIRYRDASGRRYKAGFGFTWAGDQFSPYDGEAYNYDIELKPGEDEEPPPIPPPTAVAT